MKKFQDIPTASQKELDDPLDPEFEPGHQMILDLEGQGHKVIKIDRGFAIVEQCEPNDDYPGDGPVEPLRVSVGGDVLNHFSHIYIHASENGFGAVYFRYGDIVKKAHWVLADRPNPNMSLQAAIDFLEHEGFQFARGWYTAEADNITTLGGIEIPTGKRQVDPILKETAENIRKEFIRARERLEQLNEWNPSSERIEKLREEYKRSREHAEQEIEKLRNED
jgi:hypothetical protein